MHAARVSQGRWLTFTASLAKRWLVLTGQRILSFKSKNGLRPQDIMLELHLSDCVAVTSTDKDGDNSRSTFTVRTNKKDWHFTVGCADEKDVWLNAIRKALKRAHSGELKHNPSNTSTTGVDQPLITPQSSVELGGPESRLCSEPKNFREDPGRPAALQCACLDEHYVFAPACISGDPGWINKRHTSHPFLYM